MSIPIGRWQFKGPYTYTSSLHDRSGIYAILDRRDGSYYVIDVGESATVTTRVDNHDRQNCWTRNQHGTLSVAVLYTPQLQQAGRRAIEQELRNQYAPACGIR